MTVSSRTVWKRTLLVTLRCHFKTNINSAFRRHYPAALHLQSHTLHNKVLEHPVQNVGMWQWDVLIHCVFCQMFFFFSLTSLGPSLSSADLWLINRDFPLIILKAGTEKRSCRCCFVTYLLTQKEKDERGDGASSIAIDWVLRTWRQKANQIPDTVYSQHAFVINCADR